MRARQEGLGLGTDSAGAPSAIVHTVHRLPPGLTHPEDAGRVQDGPHADTASRQPARQPRHVSGRAGIAGRDRQLRRTARCRDTRPYAAQSGLQLGKADAAAQQDNVGAAGAATAGSRKLLGCNEGAQRTQATSHQACTGGRLLPGGRAVHGSRQ